VAWPHEVGKFAAVLRPKRRPMARVTNPSVMCWTQRSSCHTGIRADVMAPGLHMCLRVVIGNVAATPLLMTLTAPRAVRKPGSTRDSPVLCAPYNGAH